ncbi:MAG: CPBP family intramembrane glutamic endopeptidase [Bacteroidota bacterium]
MNTVQKQTIHSLSLVKIILFVLACIAIFVAAAAASKLLTFWIANQPARTAISEILFRMPITIIALHFFATKVIKTYKPTAIYGKLIFSKLLKWTAFGFALPLALGMFYYLFNIMIPFAHTTALTATGKLDIFIKWFSISISAGITEEVLFRGHLFMLIRSRCSKAKAVLITSLIFGLVHIVMLPSITPLDIVIVVVGGTIAGLMFSLICLYSKSVWYAAIAHIVWDIFFIGKITAIATTQADADKIILPFKLITNNLLLTGGSFGVEVAVPSLLLYLLVIGMLYKLMQGQLNADKI